MHIRNPLEWLFTRGEAAAEIGAEPPSAYWASPTAQVPAIRKITTADLRAALAAGWQDFAASRTDVAFLCIIYPVIGLVMAGLAAHEALLPMLFPLAAGFTLLGPFAALGLYEISRRREITGQANWLDVFKVLRSPSIGSIAALGLILIALFLAWLYVANAIYNLTLGPLPQPSVGLFLTALLTTGAGWAMIVIGLAAGGVFAVAALAISVVSFPLLLDRPVGLATAIGTSLRAVRRDPGPLALWGLIVAGGLFLGSLPLFIGLIVVLPILGHSTWHLYRTLLWPRVHS